MYIIIAGGGLIGKGVAQSLADNKHDVVVIDQDKKVCEEIYSKYGALTINGNATDLETLESAKIDKCNVAIAAMRSDADNLSFALLARHFEVPQIIVRMINPMYEDVYKTAGVTNVVRSTRLLINQVLVNIETPGLRKVIDLGTLEIGIINIKEGSKISTKKIQDIAEEGSILDEIRITCVFQDSTNSFIIPNGQTVLSSGDRLFACGAHGDIVKLAKHLNST